MLEHTRDRRHCPFSSQRPIADMLASRLTLSHLITGAPRNKPSLTNWAGFVIVSKVVESAEEVLNTPCFLVELIE